MDFYFKGEFTLILVFHCKKKKSRRAKTKVIVGAVFWAAPGCYWGVVSKLIVKAGGGEKYISLLCSVAFFSTSLQSGNGHERNGLLCYSHPTGLISMCHHYQTGCFVTVRCEPLFSLSSPFSCICTEGGDATLFWHETNVSFKCCFRILWRK